MPAAPGAALASGYITKARRDLRAEKDTSAGRGQTTWREEAAAGGRDREVESIRQEEQRGLGEH